MAFHGKMNERFETLGATHIKVKSVEKGIETGPPKWKNMFACPFVGFSFRAKKLYEFFVARKLFQEHTTSYNNQRK